MQGKYVNRLRITSILLSIFFFVLMSAPIIHAEPFSLLNQWEINISDVIPVDMIVDSNDNVYVINTALSNPTFYEGGFSLAPGYIQKFDSNGSLITKWKYYDYQCSENSIAVDSKGNVFISKTFSVQKFDSNGNYIMGWGTIGRPPFPENNTKGDGLFLNLHGIAVDPSDNVYVVDMENSRIQKFSNNGQFIAQYGKFADDPGYGIITNPTDIDIDSKGNIYIVNGNYIYKFDKNFNLIGQINVPPSYYSPIISIDNSDNIYVYNFSVSETILVFNSDCTSQTYFNSEMFPAHGGICCFDLDSSGNLYLAWGNNIFEEWNIVQKYAPIPVVNFTVSPSKIRISDKVEFNASKHVIPTQDRIIWDFGDGKIDDSNSPIVYHNYSETGSYTVKLTVTDYKGRIANKSQVVNVTIPVVLVHGWKSSSDTWANMTDGLEEKGFQVWNFDYSKKNTNNPQEIPPLLSEFINKQRNDTTYNKQKYNGKIDIVCHSMGAIVSRLYMENYQGGIHGKDVRQWIGIAPAHHGSAAADFHPEGGAALLLIDTRLYVVDRIFLGPAVDELKTDSESVKLLDSGSLSPQTKYRVIAGWNPTHSPNFGSGILSATLAKNTSRSGSPYYFTYSGDMIVATEQSYDKDMQFEAFPSVNGDLGDSQANEFDHVHITGSQKVINYVVECLKDISTLSTNKKPKDDEVPFFTHLKRFINGILGIEEQQVNIFIPELIPIGSNAGPKLRNMSNNITNTPETSSIQENIILNVIVEWDDGDVAADLISPSGVKYSADSHPDNIWYFEEENSLCYIVGNPEGGNWTADLIPEEYLGYDIHYNLTYYVESVGSDGSNYYPVASFRSNVTKGFAPLTVKFTDLSSETVNSWKWDFGDGTYSTEQNPVHTYEKEGNYTVSLNSSNSAGYDIEQIAIAVKSNYAPTEQWNKLFGGTKVDEVHSVQQAFDGGYILAGYTESYGNGLSDAWLIKTDINGNKQWDKTFGGSKNEQTEAVEQTSDGGYILAGYTESYGNGLSDAWLIKTDNNGNEQWNKTFGDSKYDRICSVQQTNDGGYVLAGTKDGPYLDDYFGFGAWIIKTDSSGNEEWNQKFGGSSGIASSVQQTNDGGYIIAGYAYSNEASLHDAWLIKIDSNGNQKWSKTYGGTCSDHAHSVSQTSDGGYIVAGTLRHWIAEPNGNKHSIESPWIIKVDGNGNKQWEHTFGEGGIFNSAQSVKQTSDGGYIIAVTTDSYGGAGLCDACLIKVDSTGTEQWYKTFGRSYYDFAESVSQTSDGGYVSAATISYGFDHSVWLIKVAPEGTSSIDNAPIANAGVDETVTVGSSVTFDGSASTDDKGISSYSWDFDLSNGITTDATTIVTSHIYTSPGTYTATLTITDTAGHIATDTLQVVVSGAASTSTTSYTPTYDNRLRSASPTSVLSTTTYLDIGRSSATVRDVMLFDLSSYKTTDTISKVTLSLYWYYPAGATRTSDTVVEVYRPVEWDPKYVTWNSRASGVSWTTAGGSWYDKNGLAQGTTPYASITFPASTVPDNKYYDFDVTQLVQEYVSGKYKNTGFFLKAKTERGNYIAFYSADASNTAVRPKLTVTSVSGATAVDNLPVANAGADKTAMAGSTVIFNASASTDDKGIASYSWDFDLSNGITTEATTMTASHIYTVAGTYTATLTVTDTAGQVSTDTVQVTVSEISVDNPPVANAGVDQTATIGSTVTFDGSASTDEKGIASYSWDFDLSNGITAEATTMSASHIYTSPGTYTVTLTITDTAGHIATDTLQVVISSTASTSTAAYTPTYDNRLRSASPTSVLSTTTYLDIGRSSATVRDVMLFDLSSYKTTDTISKAILSMYWYYPAGTTRTSDTVVEVYRPVEWDPKYVTWNSRASGTLWSTAGGNWYDKNAVSQGTTPYASVTFSAATIPDNKYYDFDVTQLVQEYVSGKYKNTGIFLKAKTESGNYIAFYSAEASNTAVRPKLTVTSASGSTTVDNLPVANAGADKTATVGTSVTFDASASTDDKGIASYSWDFDLSNGIAAEATTMIASKTYTATGTYTVTLTVTDTAGQMSTDTVQVVVSSASIPASTVSYTPTYDNRLRSASPTSVLSTTTYLDIGRSSATVRDVMLFDLSSYKTTDTISKATLSLYWYYPAGTTRTSDTVVEVYRPVEWDPKYVTWNSRMSGVAWTTAGGSWYDKNAVSQGTTPYASVTFTGTKLPDNKYYEFDVTQLAQEYVSGKYKNTGFFLKARTESGNYIAFYSAEASNAAVRPKLTITS